MFNNKPNMFGGQQNASPFANNNNIFNNNAGNNTGNIFNRPNNPPAQGNNIFGNQNQGSNVFANQSQGNQMGNAFNNQAQGNIFNQGNTQNNNVFGQQQGMFNQQTNQQPNNIFQNQNQGFNQGNQQGNIFGQNTQQGNVFGQGNQQGNIFGQGNTQQQGAFFNQAVQQNNQFAQNQPPQVGAGNPNPILPAQMSYMNFMNFSPEHQQQLIRGLTNDQIRKLIDHSLKSLVEPKKLENLSLSQDNTLKNMKVNELATKFNMIKAPILFVKKEVRDKVVNPLKDLKQRDQNLATASSELAFKVSEKLQKYKESLIEAITENKMIQDIKRELIDIDSQIKEFLKPLFNAHQTRNSFSFIDPDQFCIKISEQVLKNIAFLDNKMDELLAVEGEVPAQVSDTGDIIERLVEYYENVVISMREFAERYGRLKKEALSKRRMGNIDDTLRRVAEKATVSVRKELKAYDLVKEIEQILQKREKRNTEMILE